jgi:hypothetical protein
VRHCPRTVDVDAVVGDKSSVGCLAVSLSQQSLCGVTELWQNRVASLQTILVRAFCAVDRRHKLHVIFSRALDGVLQCDRDRGLCIIRSQRLQHLNLGLLRVLIFGRGGSFLRARLECRASDREQHAGGKKNYAIS